MGLCIVGSYTDPHISQPCMGSHPVQRTSVTHRPTIEHMGIKDRLVDITSPTIHNWSATPVAMKGKYPQLGRIVAPSSFRIQIFQDLVC